jgi:hypothetical protein
MLYFHTVQRNPYGSGGVLWLVTWNTKAHMAFVPLFSCSLYTDFDKEIQ